MFRKTFEICATQLRNGWTKTQTVRKEESKENGERNWETNEQEKRVRVSVCEVVGYKCVWVSVCAWVCGRVIISACEWGKQAESALGNYGGCVRAVWCRALGAGTAQVRKSSYVRSEFAQLRNKTWTEASRGAHVVRYVGCSSWSKEKQAYICDGGRFWAAFVGEQPKWQQLNNSGALNKKRKRQF